MLPWSVVSVQPKFLAVRFFPLEMADTFDPHLNGSAFLAMDSNAGNCKKTGRDQTSPHLEVKFILLPGTTETQFQKDFPAYKDGLVYSSPGRYVVMPEYPKKAETVYNLKPRTDDVYVLTFPKCGKRKNSNSIEVT